MFVQLVKVTCYKLREERVSSGEETDKNKSVVNGSSGGVFMATAIEMLEKHKKPWWLRCAKRGRGTLGDRGGAYQRWCRWLTAQKTSILWAVLVLTTKTTWSSTATRSDHFLTYDCGHCQCFPVSDCTWFACAGVSQTMKQHRDKGSSWFCGRCGHIYKWREGSRNLSLRYGSEQDDVSLYEACPMPHAVQPGQLGDVEPFFTSWRLTPNAKDNHPPYDVQTDGASSYSVQTTCGMIQRIKTFMTKDKVEGTDVARRCVEASFQRQGWRSVSTVQSTLQIVFTTRRVGERYQYFPRRPPCRWQCDSSHTSKAHLSGERCSISKDASEKRFDKRPGANKVRSTQLEIRDGLLHARMRANVFSFMRRFVLCYSKQSQLLSALGNVVCDRNATSNCGKTAVCRMGLHFTLPSSMCSLHAVLVSSFEQWFELKSKVCHRFFSRSHTGVAFCLLHDDEIQHFHRCHPCKCFGRDGQVSVP